MVEKTNLLITTHFSWAIAWWKRIVLLVAVVHGFAFLSSGGTDFRLAPVTIVIFAGAMGWIGVADARWRKELLFLQSLGISPLMIAGFWTISVVVLEVVLTLFSLFI